MARQTRKDAFYQNTSWYIRYRDLNQAGNTIYKLKGGFGTAKEAEEYKAHCEEEYIRKSRYNSVLNADMTITEYLNIWYEETYRNTPIENNRKMVCDYAVYSWILPNIKVDLKLSAINAQYLDEILEPIAANSWSAAETARELLILAFNDAVIQKIIHRNYALETKAYPRKKPEKIYIYNTQEIRQLLEKAAESPWYLEILLALFCGLRKGEILGSKFTDFDLNNKTFYIQRQITSNPERLVEADDFFDTNVIKGKMRYRVIEKAPKFDSKRKMKCPDIVMYELAKRKELVDKQKELMGDNYYDNDYVSCQENGLTHNVSSINKALTEICSAANIPHTSVHGLRHMYASILLDNSVSLPKVSALLGHRSVNTTFENYADSIKGGQDIVDFINMEFRGNGNDEI